jgi:Ca-activated chloride channel homolog
MISAIWEKLDPGFLASVWLAIGLLAAIAIGLLEIGARRRRNQAVRMFAASHLVAALTSNVSPVKRLIKSILLTAAVGLLFVALARPHLFFDLQEEDRSGLDLLLAVDCSKSMLTQDVRPSRIERAKLAIADFADRLPADRLGLIAFAGDAFLQCPLTLDHDAFQTAVRELDTDTIPRPGTDIAAAIDQAVDALHSQPNNMKFLILVTDGEDLEGRAVDAARNAAQAGLKIYTVGVGTPSGDMIPEQDSTGAAGYHTDVNGQRVVSKLDEDTLRQIADATGGAYVELGQRGEGLDEIYNRYIAPLPKQNHEEKQEKIRIERFEWPLALATLFLMAEFMITERAGGRTGSTNHGSTSSIPSRRPPRRRPVAAATTLFTLGFFSTTLSTYAADVANAESAYKAGKYEESMNGYQKAAEDQPTRNDLQYDHGAAAYKAGEYSEAEEAFRRALDTPDLALQEKTYYNLGNAQFQHGQEMQKVDTKKTIGLWEQALHSYDSALKLRVSDDTRHNYLYVKEKLEQLKKQQQEQDKNKKGSQDGDQSGQGDESQSGQNNGQNPSPSAGDDGQQQQPGNQSDKKQSATGDATNTRTYSGKRPKDQKDPDIRSREDAENLLDSLKDDERRVTARTLSQLNGTPPPPPPSGKDW